MALIWAGAMALAYWNHSFVEEADWAREASRLTKLNKSSLEQQKESIAWVDRFLDERAAQVASLDFGLIYLRHELLQAASAQGLSAVKIEADRSLGSKGIQPLRVTFRGGLSAATRWLSAVQRALPHLVINRVAVVSKGEEPDGKFTVHLNYRYRLVSTSTEKG